MFIRAPQECRRVPLARYRHFPVHVAMCLTITIEGERSLPSMLGGGDLDGDIYSVMQYKPLLSVISWTPAE